ncbi:MAG: hypothetical protein E7459_11120, partial [Ruminococcaceae bacterium]|nr:hypothetical protein [Oscillospiraceae bacterium]
MTMKIKRKNLLALLLALVMSVSCLVSPVLATAAEPETGESHIVTDTIVTGDKAETMENRYERTEKDTTQVDILVSVEGETAFMQTSDLDVAMASMADQRADLYAAQSSMESVLGQSVEIEHYYSLVFNGFAFEGEAWMVDAINGIEGLTAMEMPKLQIVEPETDEEVTDLSPAMSVSTGMVGAINVWDLGYTGKGTVVAVIDTGIKQTHEAFSVAPEGAKIDQKYLEDVFGKYGELMHCKNTEGAYYSPKLPYGWDYFDGDCVPNHPGTTVTHGSHVAGIVAGNNGDDFKGVAPDAQIIALQIFNKSGGAAVADMLASLEDCVYLGVDAINMSLGIAAGFEHLSWLGMEDVYAALEKAGVAICASASNDAHSYAATSYGDPQYVYKRRWLVTNPDNGLIGAPGTYAPSFTVGNCKRVAMTAGGDYSKVQMVYSSSWGPTAGLKLKPEITAPGESIVSVDGGAKKADDAYTSMTGTSMSAPAVAGGVLLLKEYLKTRFPEATGKELYEMAYALMMSTAGHGNAFIRHQGSGIMNLDAAVKTDAYLTTKDDTRPKLELDDSENGTFEISFKVHNFGQTEKTYSIGHTAMTEKVSNFQYNGWQGAGGVDWAKHLGILPVLKETVTVPTINGTIRNFDAMVELLGDTTVTVAAGETATVNLTLKIKDNWLKSFWETYPAGMYLEGWINLTDQSQENAVNLSIPYLGFVGDWDHPAMFDEGWWWQEAYGENNLSQMYNSGNKGGIYVGFGTGTREYGLGINMYASGEGETYLADRNAISPNNDGYQDALNALEFSMLRQPRRVHVYLRDQEGKVLKTFVDSKYSYRKEYWVNQNTNLGFGQYELDFDWNSLAENTTVELVAEAYLDRDEYVLENNRLGSFVVPVTVDLTAPAVTAIDGGIEILDTNYIAYYAVYTDARHTNMVFEDGVFAMERGAKEVYLTDMDKYFVSVADFAHNEAFYYVEDGKVYALDAEGFDHGRTIIAQSHFDMDGCDHNTFSEECRHFAWYAFNEDFMQMPVALTEVTTEVDNPGSEGNADIINLGQAADGTIYAATNQYLYTFDLETITVNRENPIKFWYADAIEGKTIFCKAFFVAPGTNDMYGVFEKLTTSLTNNQFCSINPETGELTLLWQVNNYQYPRYAIKDANTLIMWHRNHTLDEYDIATGEKLSSVAMETKLSTGKAAYGHRGYTFPAVYDAQENCIYMAGAWSYTSYERWEQGGIIRYDYDEHKVEFFTPGSGAGLALFGLMILDKEEPEHICYVKEVVAPTCTEEGYTLRVCAECGMEVKEDITEPTGHEYEAVVTEPTCTTLGYTTYTCANCGDTYKDDYTPATDHKYGQWQTVKKATCTEKGQEKRTCECGAEEFRDVDVKGHDYKKTVTEPTCTT